MCKAQAKAPERNDLGGARHLVGTICPPARFRAFWHEQAALFIKAQRLGGDPEPAGCLGYIQELGGTAHDSPLMLLTAMLMGAAPGARSTG